MSARDAMRAATRVRPSSTHIWDARTSAYSGYAVYTTESTIIPTNMQTR